MTVSPQPSCHSVPAWVQRRLSWERQLRALEAAPRGQATTPPASPPAAIRVDGLTKRYGTRVALAGVSFQVARGEVFSLLGPNGAGKTTTVEILEGFRDRSGGTVEVLGYDPAALPLGLRRRIGVVLQECGFPSHLRVGEILAAWGAYYTRPRPLEELLAVVELDEQRDQLVRNLSGGQRRRLDLALALAGDPDLIFLDEPTTGFDPEARRRCWQAIRNLRGLGKTVVLTTHYLEEAEQLADRVAVLAGGRIRALGTPRELAAQAELPARISFRLPGAEGSAPPRGLGRADRHGDAFVLTTSDPVGAVRALLGWVRRHRLGEPQDLTVEPPRLEDAYLHLVGTGDGTGERP